MANALTEDIFVELCSETLSSQMNRGYYPEMVPTVSNVGKPSIETLIHAKLPQKFVLHIHMVEAVRFLIQVDWRRLLTLRLKHLLNWIAVEYAKPGPELAKLIEVPCETTEVAVYFLQNHGIILASDNLKIIEETVISLKKLLKIDKVANIDDAPRHSQTTIDSDGYYFSTNSNFNRLAKDEIFLKRIKNDWAICPDHVVYLGQQANIIKGKDRNLIDRTKNKSCFVFVEGMGVLEHCETTNFQKQQLQFYYDVMHVLGPEIKIKSLEEQQVADL